MAVYTPDSLNIKPPSGGFQQGGWYSGRQYWGGTLSEPGQIHPSSNQPGAGQNVSNEVIAQTNPANVAYIEQERAKAAANPVAPAAQPVVRAGTASTGTSGSAGVALPSVTPTINLPDIYKNLYESSGIKNLQNQYSDMEKSYIEAKGKINDNPFLSEATRVGRVAKLESLFNERTANIKNDIATKKADIETQLNLQTKQIDINSQMMRDSLNRANMLLEMGALNGATGEDIANLTRSTGISSEAWYSAIDAQKKKNVKTVLEKFTNDAGEVTAVVINAETGEIISKTSLGAIGNAQNGTGTTKATESSQISDVGKIISSYISNEAQQALISPEDLYTKLMAEYGLAAGYIDEHWTPEIIRNATK